MNRFRILVKSARPVLAGLFLAIALSPGADGHVNLLAPDGGEQLQVGLIYDIEWQITIQHQLQNWDLYYSTSGIGGPWKPISVDHPPGDPSTGSTHTYQWVIPDDVSNQVRVRVVMDNEFTDYEDISGSDLAIVPSTLLTTEVIATGLSYPVFVTSPPGDNRLFILEQTGKIRIVKNGALLARPFLDIESQVKFQGEQGLLGLAFHPNYADNGYFYVNYTAADPEGRTFVSRFTVSDSDADSADASSEFVILEQAQPFTNHNGGMIAFSPEDGYLYIGLGDGGSGGDPQNNAQNDDTWLGKMLRIDVDAGSPYAIPGDNPFVDDVNTLDEIWAVGLRNPWRWSFDRLSGDILIADVGQGTWEEVNYEPFFSSGGVNYGWRLKEGTHCYNPSTNCDPNSILTDPIYEYEHESGPYGFRCSITGGYVYRGCAMPDLEGTYFFADYCSGEIWSFRYDGISVSGPLNRTDELLGGNTFNITSFGEDDRGELYITDYSSSGRVLKIVPDGVPSQCAVENCCTGRLGDANGSGDEEPTIGDLSVMIDAKFVAGTCDGIVPCPAEADVNLSAVGDPVCDDITIGDISLLIDYLFVTGPDTFGPLPDCP